MKTIAILVCCLWGLSLAPSAFGENKLGKEVFQTCQPCHGAQGEGRQKLAAPPIAGMQEWYILNQLHSFRKGGRGLHPLDVAGQRMRPLARTLNSEEEVKQVAAYVAALPVPEMPQTVTGGRLLHGKNKFASTCIACHGPQARGNKDLGAPSLLQVSDWYILNQLKNFKGKRRGYDPAADPYGATMVPMAAGLEEQDMKDIAAYLHALRQK